MLFDERLRQEKQQN